MQTDLNLVSTASDLEESKVNLDSSQKWIHIFSQKKKMGRNFKENDSVEEEKLASNEDKAGEKLSIFRA